MSCILSMITPDDRRSLLSMIMPDERQLILSYAVEGNIGLHTIDPFPANASDTDIDQLGSEVIKKKAVVVVPVAPVAAAN